MCKSGNVCKHSNLTNQQGEVYLGLALLWTLAMMHLFAFLSIRRLMLGRFG